MKLQRDTLIAALQSIAKFHLAHDPSAQIEFMDTSEELFLRWRGAYINREWFLAQFNADEREALAAFNTALAAISAKYNKLPPILRFVTSADGKALCANAATLLERLRD